MREIRDIIRDYRTDEELRRDLETPSRASASFGAAARKLMASIAPASRSGGSSSPSTRGLDANRENGGAPATASGTASGKAARDVDAHAAAFSGTAAEAALSSGGKRLWETLKQTAREVGERSDRLRQRALGVGGALDGARRGDDIAATTIFRLIVAISFFWAAVSIGTAYDRSVQPALIEKNAAMLTAGGYATVDAAPMTARAAAIEAALDAAPDVHGMKARHAPEVAGLLSAFAQIAAVATLAHFALGFLLGRLSAGPTLRASARFGESIAAELKRLDDALGNAKARLDDRSRGHGDVSRDVSEAHLGAEEAALLYRDVSFLSDDPRSLGGVYADPVVEYRRYLDDLQPEPGSRWLEHLTTGLALGVILTTGAVLMAAARSPDGGLQTLGAIFGVAPREPAGAEASVLPVIFSYPGATFLFFAGLAAFALGGAIGEVLSGVFLGGARRIRLRQSLDAVRGAITSEGAPQARDIALHVEALSAIFNERLSAQVARPTGVSPNVANHTHSSGSLTEAGAGDLPEWRRTGDPAPRFVAPAFEAAPKAFLAGPDGRPPRRAMKVAASLEPGAKRSLFPFGARKSR